MEKPAGFVPIVARTAHFVFHLKNQYTVQVTQIQQLGSGRVDSLSIDSSIV